MYIYIQIYMYFNFMFGLIILLRIFKFNTYNTFIYKEYIYIYTMSHIRVTSGSGFLCMATVRDVVNIHQALGGVTLLFQQLLILHFAKMNMVIV